MENQEQEARMTILEARVAFCESRLAVMERSFGGIIQSTRRRKRQLTDDEKKAVVARLTAGREAAQAKRDTEAKAQAKTTKKKEATNGAPTAAK